MGRTVVALEQARGVESRNPARIVLTELGHRKRARDGSAILGFVFQDLAKRQPPQRPGRYVPGDIDLRHTLPERTADPRAPKVELRRCRTAIFGQHQPTRLEIAPYGWPDPLDLIDHAPLHAFPRDQQAERMRLQPGSQECRGSTHAAEIASIEPAEVIARRREYGVARDADERQQVGAPEPPLAPPADAQTWQQSRIGPATQ